VYRAKSKAESDHYVEVFHSIFFASAQIRFQISKHVTAQVKRKMPWNMVRSSVDYRF